MKQTSKSSTELPARFGRLSVAIVFMAAGLLLEPGKAGGQTIACRDLISNMAAQQKMIGIFRTLDYQAREHFLILANAIMSTYGGWSTKGSWATNAGQFRDSAGDFEEQVVDIRREIGRDKAISAEELERVNGSIDDLMFLIETGTLISIEIEAGRIDDANLAYYDTARTKYLEVHRDLYTLITTAEKRVASMAQKPCS